MSYTEVGNTGLALPSPVRVHRTTASATGRRQHRLLVISYHFPPDGAVGGWRWAGLAKYLARRGWEVHVVTAAQHDAPPDEPGVHVHRVARARTLNDAYNTWASRRRASGPHQVIGPDADLTTPQPLRSRPSVLRAIRKNLAVALALPDVGRGWILRAASAARALLHTHQFDAVISSGPPHSAHLAAMLACAGRSVARWVDLRDPWAATLDALSPGVTPPPMTIGRLFVRGLERLVLRGTRRFVTNTPEFAEFMRAAYAPRRVVCVPNGIDFDRLPAAQAPKFAELSITYAGTLYLQRNLTPVVIALRDFLESNPAARGSVRLRVAGSMEGEHAARFWREVDAAGLHDSVKTLGRVSPDEAVDLVSRSHLALVLAPDQPAQIPAKLYECAGLRVPTLVLAESASATAREARRIGAITHEAGDIASINRIIDSLWIDRDSVPFPRGAIGYDVMAGQMDALLRSAAARSTAAVGQRSDAAQSVT